MIGPKHYATAENLIESANRLAADVTTANAAAMGSAIALLHAKAQVHATLAVAAAVVDTMAEHNTYLGHDWGEVLRP